MSTAVFTSRFELPSVSGSALKAAERFWFLAAVAGQWIFLYYIVAFYGPSTVTGNFESWSRNTMLPKGYVSGDTIGNLTFGVHALLAGVTSFGGALQLVPWIRERALALHRWNGRVFLVTAMAVSVTGLYMVWVRGTRFGVITSIAITLDALLILAFAVLAWRSAVRREIATHRRWAWRTYLVANGQWFFRVGTFAWILLNEGPVGITDNGMGGPWVLFWSFGSYLVPLAVLELHERASAAAPHARLAMAGGLVVLTLLMLVGIFGVTMLMWRPILARL